MIEVKDAEGRTPSPSAYIRSLEGKTTLSFESRYAQWLKPGESFIDEVSVTEFYDLSRPGKYTISILREIPPKQNLGEGSVKSNTVTVVVTP